MGGRMTTEFAPGLAPSRRPAPGPMSLFKASFLRAPGAFYDLRAAGRAVWAGRSGLLRGACSFCACQGRRVEPQTRLLSPEGNGGIPWRAQLSSRRSSPMADDQAAQCPICSRSGGGGPVSGTPPREPSPVPPGPVVRDPDDGPSPPTRRECRPVHSRRPFSFPSMGRRSPGR